MVEGALVTRPGIASRKGALLNNKPRDRWNEASYNGERRMPLTPLQLTCRHRQRGDVGVFTKFDTQRSKTEAIETWQAEYETVKTERNKEGGSPICFDGGASGAQVRYVSISAHCKLGTVFVRPAQQPCIP